MLKFLSKAAFYLSGKEPFLNNREKQICRTSALLFGSPCESAVSRLLFARQLSQGATGGRCSLHGAGAARRITIPSSLSLLSHLYSFTSLATAARKAKGNKGDNCILLPTDVRLFGGVFFPEYCPAMV